VGLQLGGLYDRLHTLGKITGTPSSFWAVGFQDGQFRRRLLRLWATNLPEFRQEFA
jgi:hypothetical protein